MLLPIALPNASAAICVAATFPPLAMAVDTALEPPKVDHQLPGLSFAHARLKDAYAKGIAVACKSTAVQSATLTTKSLASGTPTAANALLTG